MIESRIIKIQVFLSEILRQIDWYMVSPSSRILYLINQITASNTPLLKLNTLQTTVECHKDVKKVTKTQQW